MSTRFFGEGNIGSKPEYHEFPNENADEPHRLVRLNVYFDNPVPLKSGGFEDRGGFWMQVELWHRDAEPWSKLLQTGMRVLIEGRMRRETWQDRDDNPQNTTKIEARRVAVLLYRIEDITVSPKSAEPPGDE